MAELNLTEIRIIMENKLIEEMAQAIRNLLKSADCTWYERNEGHDWKDAVDEAEKIINHYNEIMEGEK